MSSSTFSLTTRGGPAWWEAALIYAADRDEIAINPIVYAEIASGFAAMAALDAHLRAGGFRRLPPLGAEAREQS
jgi:hypothetical protein